MLDILTRLPIILWTLWVFIAGCAVGSWLNVCIGRIPLEKSTLWPGSRCMTCLKPVRWFDNIPLLSYWILRGRCRSCGASFSIRYFLIELFTGLSFVGLFFAEIVFNIHDLPPFRGQRGFILAGMIEADIWLFWLHHAILVSFLIACSMCDFDRREIPLNMTITGMIVGLVSSVLYPWPWPMDVATPGLVPKGPEWWLLTPPDVIPTGLYPWPVWGPLPDWMPLGSHLAGLATGLAGALVGTFFVRGVRAVFSKGLGREALGLGDADLMMMVGAFLGWQPVVVAFFAGAMVTLVFAIAQMIITRDNALPFGPGLAAGSVLTMLCWRWIGPAVQPLFFNVFILMVAVGAGAACMLIFGGLFRGLRGPEVTESV